MKWKFWRKQSSVLEQVSKEDFNPFYSSLEKLALNLKILDQLDINTGAFISSIRTSPYYFSKNTNLYDSPFDDNTKYALAEKTIPEKQIWNLLSYTEEQHYLDSMKSKKENHAFIKEKDKSHHDTIQSTLETQKVIQQEVIIKNQSNILRNLHRIINHLEEECKQEGFDTFSETARENTQQILNEVYVEFPDYDYDIYPTENQEIAIDLTPQPGRGILILCDSKGSVAYFSTLDGKNSHFRCDNIEDFLSNNLLWKVLHKLDDKNQLNQFEKFSSKNTLLELKTPKPLNWEKVNYISHKEDRYIQNA